MTTREYREENETACFGCGRYGDRRDWHSIDLSREDEYYPEIRYLCPGCSGGDRGE